MTTNKTKKNRAPVAETIGNQSSIRATLASLNSARAGLIDADQKVRVIAESAGSMLGEEMMADIRDKYITTAWTACKTHLDTLKTENRRAVALIAESNDYSAMAKLTEFLLNNEIFPADPEKTEKTEEKTETEKTEDNA